MLQGRWRVFPNLPFHTALGFTSSHLEAGLESITNGLEVALDAYIYDRLWLAYIVRFAGQVHKLARVTGFSVYWRIDDKER